MRRIEWLHKQHSVLAKQVDEIESQRQNDRSAELKALLVSLKKQKLAIKTELEREKITN
jgi:uncharacterized protein YdcH (DUF465 family)